MLMEIVFANQHQIVFQEAITFSILFILLVVCSRKQFPKTFLIFDVFVWLHWQKSASVTTTSVTHISDNQHCNGGAVSNGNLGNKSDVQTCGEDCVTLFGSQIKFITFRKSNINHVNGNCFCESTGDCASRTNENLDFIYSVFCMYTKSETISSFAGKQNFYQTN